MQHRLEPQKPLIQVHLPQMYEVSSYTYQMYMPLEYEVLTSVQLRLSERSLGQATAACFLPICSLGKESSTSAAHLPPP